MLAKIKLYFHKTRWTIFRIWLFIRSIPHFMWLWIKEYWFHQKQICKGVTSFTDVPTVVVLLFKAIVVSAVIAYRDIREWYHDEVVFVEYKVNKAQETVLQPKLKWFELSLKFIRDKRYDDHLRRAVKIGFFRVGTIIEGEYKHVSENQGVVEKPT